MQTTILIDSTEPVLSRSDRAAVELAIRMSDHSDVSVCCPSGNESVVRYAIASGASKLVSLDDVEAGLIVCGLGGLGLEGELTAARLAKRHKSQLVLDILELSKTGNQLQVIRKLDRGEKEILKFSLPGVLVMSEAATTSLYLSRYRQQQVSISSSEAKSQSATQPALQWSAVRPRTKTTELATKTGGDAHQRMFAAFGITNVSTGMAPSDADSIPSDPDDCAMQLIRYLSHHGFLQAPKIEDSQLLPAEIQIDSQGLCLPSVKIPQFGTHTAFDSLAEKTRSSLFRRPRPRPLQQSQEIFQAKLDRQPRSLKQIGVKNPLVIDSLPARFRRRPRLLHQSAPAQRRGPYPVTPPANIYPSI